MHVDRTCKAARPFRLSNPSGIARSRKARCNTRHEHQIARSPLWLSDIRRKNSRRHLTLGAGIHFCLGAPLTRLEMKISLEALSKRYPRMQLAPNEPVAHYETFIMRAPESLLVDLNG